MWNISMHVFRTLLRILAVALCSLPMDGQTADTGAIASSVSDLAEPWFHVRRRSSTVRPPERSTISLKMRTGISRLRATMI
jgi:hypothetical protein